PTGDRERDMQACDRAPRQACAGIAQLNAEPDLPGAALEHLPVSKNNDARGEPVSRESQTDIRANARRLSGGHRYDRNRIRARRNARSEERRVGKESRTRGWGY